VRWRKEEGGRRKRTEEVEGGSRKRSEEEGESEKEED